MPESTFTAQLALAHRLASDGKLVLAAAAIAGLVGAGVPDLIPPDDIYSMPLSNYVACVLIELERGHQRGALVAIECMQRIYCDEPRIDLRMLKGSATPRKHPRRTPTLRLVSEVPHA